MLSDTHLASAGTEPAGGGSVPIPWDKPFSKRFVLQKTNSGARLTAAPESAPSRLYVYQALYAVFLAVSLSAMTAYWSSTSFWSSPRPVLVLLLVALGYVPTLVAEIFVWRSAPGRSSFPRVARSVEIRGDFDARGSERPYRGASSAGTLDAVVIDGTTFSADQVEGVCLVDWRTRNEGAKYGTLIQTHAALVLVTMDDEGRRVPYELDVFARRNDDEEDALAACALLARLLAKEPLEPVHLPENVGLHMPWYSEQGHVYMSMLMNAGIVIIFATTRLSTSTAADVICPVAWLVLSSVINRWHSNREMYRRNGVALSIARACHEERSPASPRC